MINLIPMPSSHKMFDGYCFLGEKLTLKSDFDLPLVKLERSEKADITVTKDASLPEEAYTLSIKQDGICITAGTQTGAYYALQSLRQISRYELGVRRVPCCTVSDRPKYKWRGMQLDESRHFFGKDEVKRLLDLMFMMKLNVFHWHLTDDIGWRVEIDKYPLLTKIGSKRAYTQVNGWGSKEIDNTPHSGYYTKADVAEIIEYAAQRGIMIVPEIDFPAHCACVLAAYPELACREIKTEVPGYLGNTIPERVYGIKDWNRTICVGKEKTITFVLDIIDEITDLFPAPYFHIGGDEAPKDEWKKCPHCQKVIKDNNLKDEEDLQGWFNNIICSHLNKKGKRLIGWNEVLKAGNLDKSVVVQYWTPQRDRNVEKYCKQGGSVILSNHQSFYFDMPYAQYPLKNTYNYSPKKYRIDSKNSQNNVLGVEAEVWTEWIDCRERLDFMIFPRMQALAENAWSDSDGKNFDGFMQRLSNFKPFFKLLDVNYAVDSVSMPKNHFERVKIRKKFHCGDTHLENKINKEKEEYIW